LLISREMVDGMTAGSVIVDVAASTGGNCELTKPGETVTYRGVSILGPTDLAGRVATDASQMYSRNLASFIGRISDEDAGLIVDFDDEIVSGANITHDGHITHPVTRRALGLDGDT
jgi:NAD(P) transhydrogenase subunit alpha